MSSSRISLIIAQLLLDRSRDRVICAKTCCAPCCGSGAPALTGVKAKAVTEVACPDAAGMTPETVVATRS